MRGSRLSGRFRLEGIPKITKRLWDKLPPGLQLASQLPEPIFTPSTKAEQGHDENIDMAECARILGEDLAERVKELSLEVYSAGSRSRRPARHYRRRHQIRIRPVRGELLLIDECLTPDSSRFWPKDQYVVGQSPPSFDKQFVRDYLETLDWDKNRSRPAIAGRRSSRKLRRNMSKRSRGLRAISWRRLFCAKRFRSAASPRAAFLTAGRTTRSVIP